MVSPDVKAKAAAVVEMYLQAKEMMKQQGMNSVSGVSIRKDRSQNAKNVSDTTFRKVADRENYTRIINKIDAYVSQLLEEEQIIAYQKVLNSNPPSDHVVLSQLREKGFRIKGYAYRNLIDSLNYDFASFAVNINGNGGNYSG